MILFINRLLEKGGSWIFSILLCVIVIAFVFTIGASPGLTQKEKGLGDTEYYGVNISQNSKEWRDVSRKANIQATLQLGQLLNNPRFRSYASSMISNQTQRIALENLPLVQLARKLGIPDASMDELKAYVEEQSYFQDTPQNSPPGTQGKFSRNKYLDFMDQLEGNGAKESFVPASEEAILVGKFQEILKSPGLALPFEAEAKIRNDQTVWSIEIAILESKPDAKDKPTPSDEELEALYKETLDQYKSKETREVSYLVFPAQFEHPTNTQLKEYYENHSALYLPEEEEKENKEDKKDGKPSIPQKAEVKKGDKKEIPPYAGLAYEIKRDIYEDYLQEKQLVQPALQTAGSVAEDLLDEFYNGGNPIPRKEALKTVEALKLPFSKMPAFSQDAFPKARFLRNLNAPFIDHKPSDDENSQAEKLLKQTFFLNEENFYTNPYRIGDKYVILLLHSINPSKSPGFVDLKKDKAQFEKLVSVWEDRESDKAFSTKRGNVEAAIQTSLDSGKVLETSVKGLEKSAGWSVQYVKHKDFKTDSLPKGLPQKVFEIAKGLGKNETSAMEIVDGKGYMVAVISQEIPGYTIKHPKVKQELARLSRSSARTSLSQEMIKRGQAAMKVNIFAQPEDN